MLGKKYVMAVDNGSQSTKVSIFDLQGNQVCFSYKVGRDLFVTQSGIAVHPDDDIWDCVYGAIKSCLKKFDGNTHDIIAIGLCTIRCCRVLLKKDGSLAEPIINWIDARMLKPYEHKSEDVAYVTTTSGYLAFRMTGEMKDTSGNLEVHWPLNHSTLEWDNDTCIKEHGLTREMLFSLVKPAEAYGTLTSELAKDFGFSKDIPVVATSNDKAVELLGSGILDKHTIMVSLGSFISAALYRKNYWENAQNFFPTLASIPFHYMYECNGIRGGMWTISWFKKLLGDDLVRQANELGVSPEDYLNNKAQAIPPRCEGLISVLDWIPDANNPYRRGAMLGFTNQHTKYHMYRSILEAIGYEIKNNIDVMLAELGDTLKAITIIGGGSRSDVMMQIIADMFNISTSRLVVDSAACLGAAICACKYLGVYSSFDEAISRMVRIKDSFMPHENNHILYDEVHNTVIRKIKTHTDEIFNLYPRIFGY